MTNEEAIKTIEHRFDIMAYGETKALGEALDVAIKALKQQKVGYKEWVQYDPCPHLGNYHCSLCRAIIDRRDKYCHECGAKMEETKHADK